MRETGPVSKVLGAEDGGDHSDAKPYIGPARTILGELKNQMQLGGLDQGKVTRRIPDGTLIIAESRFGLDKITIIAPSPPPPPQEEFTPPTTEPPEEPEWSENIPDLPLEQDQFAVCGNAGFEYPGHSSGLLHAWVWKPGDAAATEIPGPPGAVSWWANAISNDGRVVVGGWLDDTSVQRAYRWTAADGAQDLQSPIPASTVQCEATGVSGDGRVIVGHGPRIIDDAQHTCSWAWTGGNYTILPGSEGTAAKVSPNGKYIFAAIPKQYQFGESDYVLGGQYYYRPTMADAARGALWVAGGGGTYQGPTQLPDSSAVAIYVTPETVKTYTAVIPYSILPGNVADNGTVCGNAPFAARCILGGAIEFLTPPGQTPAPTPVGVQPVNSGPNGESTEAVGIAANGGRIAGNLNDTHNTFVWEPGTGLIRNLPGVGAILHDMSRDGTRYCGETAFVSGSNPSALYFAASGRVVIGALPDSLSMVATGVASSTARIPPVPPKPVPLDFAPSDS